MSNTVITNYSNVSGNTTETDKSLVIIVNKDGSVSLEKDTIKSLLDKKYENTSVSIVRMNEDGKPDDASDHSSDESVPHINLTVDAFFNPVPSKDFEKDVQNEYISDLFGSEISLLGFQNDHCYTPLTSPRQSRCNSESENQLLKDDTESYSAIPQKQQIPSSKKITVLESKVIAKGKGVPYFNTNSEVFKGSDIIKRPVNNHPSAVSQISPVIKKIDPDRALYHKTVDESIAVFKKKYDHSDDESLADDLDSDDNLNLENKNKSLLRRDVKKILSRKIELKNNGGLNILDQDNLSVQDRTKKSPKTYNRILDDKTKNLHLLKQQEHIKKPEQVKQMLLVNPKTVTESEVFKNAPKSEIKADLQKQQKSMIKRDKKAPSRMTALYNDMSSLFSTPDVIRRISTDSKTNTKYSEGVYKIPHHDNKITDPPISPKITSTKTYSNSSTRHIADDSNELLNRRLKDTINVMPDQLFPDSMLNPVVPVQSQIIDKLDISNSISNNVLMSSVPLNSAVMNAPLSPSLDLLGGLQPDEEGLTEDLLRHVAQLVESSENLQEVIDKQVLGKVNDITPKDPNKLHSVMKPIVPVSNPMQENEKTFINTSVLKKEPIQIMRSNGRIITLPPIEAPATRSSKRRSLLNTSIEQAVPNIAPSEINKVMIQAQPSPTPKPTPSKQTQKVAEQTIPKTSVLSQLQYDKREEDAESDESWNSEDDPDRLWCICKQPHNNRFMICCDLCEDWFHGKCVNVTKAMGQEMEEKGIEWRCPNCLKKKALANAALKSPPLRKSTDNKFDSKIVEDRSHRTSEMTTSIDTNTNCIVCKKAARASSIYCSDGCILKHAQESLIIATPPSNPNVKNIRDPLNKTKAETRVIVYERKTGKLITGPTAPTPSNLKVWLQEHPTYEVVHPTTASGSDKQTPHLKPKPKSPQTKVQSVLQIGQDKNLSIVQPSPKNSTPTPKPPVKQTIQIIPPSLKSPPIKTQTVKQPLKSPTTPKTPTPQPKQLRSPPTPTYQRRDDSTPRRSSSIEPIRENVRKALQEQISLRMTESKDIRLSQEEVNKFALDTEHELHDLFKDVGAKYKAKYRSLMFNLKDRKNLTLWQKICERTMTAKQLVRLSPEELASQELAQWRDKEAKHQLELIKKSELDLLSCSKTYVLKTHKGEEVMESRTTGTAELDPNVSVEDLVSELNKSVDTGDNSIGSGSRPSSPVTLHSTPIATSHDTHHSSSHHKHSRNRSRSYNRSKSHKSSKSNKSNHSSKDDKSTRKHSTSRDRKTDSRSHHRKNSRDKDKSDKRDKNTRSRDDTKRSSRSKNDSDRKRSTSNDKRPSSSSTSKDDYKNISRSNKTDLKPIKEEIKYDSHIKLEDIKSPILFDDKSDMKNFDTLYKIERDMKSPYNEFPTTPDISFNQKLLSGGESDQEPSSTVDSLNSAVWNGCLNMIDVAKFNVMAQEVSGQSDDVIYELDSDLDIVGRISADTVWDYITKMKKQGSKDMLILKFVANTKEDVAQYMELYNYLDSRSRLGVIKVNNNGGIKDFYILPLPAAKSLHSVLLPLNGPGFGDSKPDLLIGIIVKQRRKRQASALHPIPPKVPKIVERICASPSEGSYTPPSRSPKRKIPLPSSTGMLSGMPLPSLMTNLPSGIMEKITASLACADDDDEPYSPGGSDSRSQESSNSPHVRYDASHNAASSELQKKMEELTRKIEEEKKQIENMAVNNSGDALDEPYSPSRPMSPPTKEPTIQLLSNIFLPSNLQEILATVKKNSSMPAGDSPRPAEYIPTNISSTVNQSQSPFSNEMASTNDVDMRMMNPPPYPPILAAFAQPETSHKGASKLSSLSEAELLSMVPDDEVLHSPNASLPLFPPLPIAPPLPHANICVPPPPYKKPRMDYNQPPPPGLDDNI